MSHDRLVEEQKAYYRARAAEYDEWFLRHGRYDRGPDHTRQWFAEVAEVRGALDALAPFGHVLEMACGTGLWTERLAADADSLTALDASGEMIDLNRARVDSATVTYQQVDLFTWQPDRRYDLIFFGFWLSHVPPERFAPFWSLVKSALAPTGRVFFVDSLHNVYSTSADQPLGAQDDTVVNRRLNDGRQFEIVKVFYEPASLATQLNELGWSIKVCATDHHFLYGAGKSS